MSLVWTKELVIANLTVGLAGLTKIVIGPFFSIPEWLDSPNIERVLNTIGLCLMVVVTWAVVHLWDRGKKKPDIEISQSDL